jgi:hypothetical protein
MSTGMSDSNGRKMNKQHGNSVGDDTWDVLESVRLSPRSNISDLTKTPTSNMNEPNVDGSPETQLSAEEFVDSYDDPVAAEAAYDKRAYNEAAGAADSDDEEGGKEGYAALRECLLDRAAHNDEVFPEDREDDATVASSSDAHLFIEIPGAPPGWKKPGAPENWKGPVNHPKCPVPKFEKVDNPGGWSRFNYQPKYSKPPGKGKPYTYMYHCTASGATPVPKFQGERKCAGWTFNYDGSWVRDINKTQFRSGATNENPFPEERKGSLDAEVLSKLGMTSERMLEADGAPDSLFFHQLLLPIIDPVASGIKDDPRKPFYSKVSLFSNLYAIGELGLGNGVGHKFTTTDGPELLRFDGVVQRDGVLGGSGGAIFRRFDTRKDNAMFSEEIYKAMSKTRWLELKRVMKLCNNREHPKAGEEGFDPAYKFDLIYDVLTSNVNALSRRAGLDLCGDESTWGHQGYADGVSGLLGLVIGKPHITKGGQVTFVTDVDRVRPRAYVHRHNLHKKNFTLQGQNEVAMIIDQLELLMINEDSILDDLENADPQASAPKGLFTEKPHITWDNYFSGEKIMTHAGKLGYGLTMTCRKDRLPSGVPEKYFHKNPQAGVNPRTRSTRYEQPIFLHKTIEDDPNSLLQLCSFQSTGPTNIFSVNALNACGLFARTKVRGRGKMKRKWAIEMNHSRQLYLATYGKVDTIDHLVKNCNLSYRCVICLVACVVNFH